MPTTNRVNADFHQVAIANATTGDVTGLDISGNLFVGARTNFSAPGNILIPAGNTNQAVITNGIGVLRWGNVAASTGAAGNTTEVQYNNVGAFGANSFFTFDTTSNTVSANSLNVNGNLTVGGIANLNSNANLVITGGTNGQALSTDGTGNLSWVSVGGGTSSLPIITRYATNTLTLAASNGPIQFGAVNPSTFYTAIAGLTYNNSTGVFTNTSGAVMYLSVTWSMVFSANATGRRRMSLDVDNAIILGSCEYNAVSGGVTALASSASFRLNNGSTFNCNYTQSSGTTLTNCTAEICIYKIIA